jgi:hypothetical protein
VPVQLYVSFKVSVDAAFVVSSMRAIGVSSITGLLLLKLCPCVDEPALSVVVKA